MLAGGTVCSDFHRWRSCTGACGMWRPLDRCPCLLLPIRFHSEMKPPLWIVMALVFSQLMSTDGSKLFFFFSRWLSISPCLDRSEGCVLPRLTLGTKLKTKWTSSAGNKCLHTPSQEGVKIITFMYVRRRVQLHPYMRKNIIHSIFEPEEPWNRIFCVSLSWGILRHSWVRLSQQHTTLYTEQAKSPVGWKYW